MASSTSPNTMLHDTIKLTHLHQLKGVPYFLYYSEETMGLVRKSDGDFWYGIEFLRIGWNSGKWYLFTNQFHLSNDADINVDILLIIVLKSRSRSSTSSSRPAH